MLTQYYLPILVIFGGVIDTQCCNYCHLPSDFSSKFQSSMTIFHHKLMTREGRVLANGCTPPSIIHDSICSRIHKKCHPKSHHIDTKYHSLCHSQVPSVNKTSFFPSSYVYLHMRPMMVTRGTKFLKCMNVM